MVSLRDTIRNYKLSLGFLIIIALFLSFGLIATREIFVLGNFTGMIYRHPLVVSNASLTAALNITKMHRSMKDVVLAPSGTRLEEALQAVDADEKVVYAQLDLIRDNILGAEGQYLERETRQLFAEWSPIRQEVVLLSRSGKREAAALITQGKGAQHVEMLESKMGELALYARQMADSFIASVQMRMEQVEHIAISLTIAGVLVSALIALFTTSRVRQDERMLRTEKNNLQKALVEIKTLRGILPVCSFCKQIRDEKGLWQKMEVYIQEHSEADFSHGVCPDCMKKHYPEEYAELVAIRRMNQASVGLGLF
ncbi:MAG: MCP four helix bundle domain-containing protein [Proteobacteria bacterium]|nr:MCP four helix bundle domain-containing protein [Pseudomonadota bacterium]MBU4296196.1 MCP four helix bundle domain-containing protein [Pseudomonadota bacterium]MCG2748602.1 MCP four helix bundle domain-containing protein [Desulfobulbaceae bacterium]